MFFLAPEPHIIVITGLCQSPGALRTDIGGQMDTGGAASSDLSSDAIIHCFLLWHFPPDKDMDVWKHFPKSFDRTHQSTETV